MKPGTRCECRETACSNEYQHGTEGGAGRWNECAADAVRLVTVERMDGADAVGFARFREVPLCAACAEYHEKKAVAS